MLSYSRRLFVKAFLNERQDDWREGIAAAFTHFGGVPRTLLGDNARALVLGRDRATGTVTFPSGLSGLLSRLGRAAARVCAVSRADQRQDGSGRQIRQAQCAGRISAFDSFARARAAPRGVDGDGRSARATARRTKRRSMRFERDERARPAPVAAARRCRVASSACAGASRIDAFVDVDTVRYSVPHRLVRDHVEVVDRGSATSGSSTAPRSSRRTRDQPSRLPGWSIRRISPACGARAPDDRADARALARAGARPRRLRRGRGRWPMSVVIHARVVEQLTRLRLGYVAERLDAVLNEAARTEPTYLDFLDGVLRQEVDAKQRTRVAMGLKIAHFPTVKTLDDFEFKFQPSVDQRLVRELATARFLAQAENVLIFGAPGVGKTHLAIALGRAVVEAGHSVLFTSATALLAALSKAETDGQLERPPDVLHASRSC